MNSSINVRGDRGRTFLWHAVNRVCGADIHADRAVEIDKAVFILRCGGDPTVADDHGVTPLQIALQEGDVVAARLLLDYLSTNSALKGFQDKSTLNDLLVRHIGSFRDAGLLRMILDLGANVNIRNLNGETPLIEESRVGHQEGIKMLLRRDDVDLQAKSRDGSTALHVAARNNQLQAVDLLLQDRRININGLDSSGNAAFWWSSYLEYDEVSKRFLDEQRLDVNFRGSRFGTRSRTTALYLAVFRNNLPLVSRMLEAAHLPLDPNILGDHRWSPLGAAAYQGLYDMVKLLLGVKGIRINAVDKGEDDPLWLAIQTRSRSVVELFLCKRTWLDINCQNNKNGDTYLLAAARDGDLQLVDLILGFGGVNLNARNERGESALKVSCHHKHHHIFQRLAGLGAVY